MSSAPADSSPPLRNRSFRFFLCARAAATIAYQMAGVAVGWQVYELTHRALDLGLVGLVQFIPSLVLVLFVGHVADRHDRRRIVSMAQLAEAAALIGLTAATMLHWANRETIFLFVFAIGIARAFEYSTLQTLVPSLVEPEVLPQAMAVSSSVSQGATIIGPMLGGFLYIAGPGAVYGTSCILFLFSAITIATIRIRRAVPLREPASLRTLFAGIAFIRSRPVVLGAISLDLFAVLLGGATALLPIYARDILFAGPRGLGFLRAAPAVGALAASLYLARQPLRARVGRVLYASVAWFGAMTIVFALSRSILLSFAALAVLGFADMVSVVIRASLVQLETPDEMRGRVSAVNAVFIGTSNQLGEFESGLTADWFGVVPAALLGGIGTLAVVVLWIWLFPQLLKRERLQAG
ncbi:MAG: MFS transporter [Desulfuromonadales bacterium]|nr:MAG: MFS transporter [Desulfuromonadales bacterium]